MTPAFKITIDGRDVTARFAGVASFTLNDNRAFIADTLTISVADAADELELPAKGARIRIAIGWRGEDLVDKGEYVVDGVSFAWPGDQITIRARSANIKETMNVQRHKSYDDTTLGEILGQVAKRQSLEAAVNAELGSIAIPHLDQTDESDGHFLARLGRTFGAVATVKDGRLVFTPLSRGKKVTGSPMDPVTIRRQDTSDGTYDDQQRASQFTACRAKYYDIASAKNVAITVVAETAEEGSDQKTKTLGDLYPDEAQATEAAKAELRRLSDLGTTVALSLTRGNAELITETPVRLEGFKAAIDAVEWVVDKLEHRASSEGFRTNVTLVPIAADSSA